MKKTFSAMWSEALGKALSELNVAPYPMSLVGDDIKAVISAVNQGIDAHLQACFMPDRGDSYVPSENGRRLECNVSAESLPVLVRRLLESGEDRAMGLASSICETIGIELI